MKVKLIIASLLCSCHFVLAQKLEKIRSFDLGFTPTSASIDRQGYLYFASEDGAIDKLNSQGEVLFHFSPQKQGIPTIIDAWQGLRTFIYYKDFQEYLLLDRFLNPSERYRINNSQFSNFSGLATFSNDNNLWILNDQELSLSKVDINDREVYVENNLNLSLNLSSWNVQFMRSYQNYLFISEAEEGILAFDNLGTFIEKISDQKTAFFTFNKNDIVFLSDNKLQLIDLYKKTKREVGLPDLPYQFVLMENNQIFLVHNQTVDVFKLN